MVAVYFMAHYLFDTCSFICEFRAIAFELYKLIAILFKHVFIDCIGCSDNIEHNGEINEARIKENESERQM